MFFRQYRFKCVCGRWAKGRYDISAEELPLRYSVTTYPMHQTKSACKCGKTLADLDADIAAKRRKEVAVAHG